MRAVVFSFLSSVCFYLLSVSMEFEGVRMHLRPLALDDFVLDGVSIPRRKRSCSAERKERTETREILSMFEAATILIEMAYSGMGCCDDANKSGKRKRAPTKKMETMPLMKKQRKKARKEIQLSSTLDMPTAMRDRITEMGGHEIKLVIQKQLQDTDLNKNHGRLSLPSLKLITDFTTVEEEKVLNQQEKKSKKGINVLIIDHLLRESSICLKKWKIGSHNIYCLMTQWNTFVEETLLKSGDFIQLWSFRKNSVETATGRVRSELCLAMVKLDMADCV